MMHKLKSLGMAMAVPCLLLTACEEPPPEVVEQIRAIKTITVADRSSGQLRRFPGIVEAIRNTPLQLVAPTP